MIEKRAYIFVCHIPGKNPTPYTAPLLSPLSIPPCSAKDACTLSTAPAL